MDGRADTWTDGEEDMALKKRERRVEILGGYEDAGRIYRAACWGEIQGDERVGQQRVAAGEWLQAKCWARVPELLQ